MNKILDNCKFGSCIVTSPDQKLELFMRAHASSLNVNYKVL